MKKKLGRHVRGNIVGYAALFVALGGSAYAASELPPNSVGTTQLRDRAVTARKVAKHTLTTGNVKAYSLRGDTDIKLGSVGGYVIAKGGVQARNLAAHAVTASKLSVQTYTSADTRLCASGGGSCDVGSADARCPGGSVLGGGWVGGPFDGVVLASQADGDGRGWRVEMLDNSPYGATFHAEARCASSAPSSSRGVSAREAAHG